MKIFLSWSGERSKAVASMFSDWVTCVLQAVDPWISTRDIDRGAVWFNEIGDQLQDVTMGIVFLTQDNKDRPWILFESGALYKGLKQRVCTLLIDLAPADVQAPLGQFNHTQPTEDSIRALLSTMNSRLALPLDERILEQVFAMYWPKFKEDFDRILEGTQIAQVPAAPRSEQNLLAEILENTRSLAKRLGTLEQRVPLVSSPTTIAEIASMSKWGLPEARTVFQEAARNENMPRGLLAAMPEAPLKDSKGKGER